MENIVQNPLYDWQGNYHLPNFSQIKDSDFKDSFSFVLKEAEEELESLANSTAKEVDDFLIPYELSGKKLDRFCAIFWLYASVNSNDTLQNYELDFSTELSRFGSKWMQDDRLFQKIEALYQKREAFDQETQQVLKRYYKGFLASGIKLSSDDKKKLRDIEQEKTQLQARFAQNVLNEEANWVMVLEEEDLDGLPEDLVLAMQSLAKEKGKEAAYALNLSRSMVEEFLRFSKRRDLRKKVFQAFIGRGDQANSYNNQEILRQILSLRAQKAKLLGFESFAQFKIEPMMAKTPERVFNLLMPLWERARLKAEDEAKILNELAQEDALTEGISGHDWRYYAEKLRLRQYDFDEAILKPYLTLENILSAAFSVANKLFGLDFEELPNTPLWHKEARLFRVYNAQKTFIGYFIGDYFARPSKRSGAWMSALQQQHKLIVDQYPIIYNICNFIKPPKGEAVLLSWQDACTLFHEFGHALHGLLSNVTYPSISGTSVARDFVELPSQLYEHWLMTPEILKQYARHYQTGEALPESLFVKLEKAKHFNAGFEAVEFLSSALFDMYLHEGKAISDINAFEAKIRTKLKVPSAIAMRHRAPHFTHIFANDGYAAGYYSYMWSEVLDADAFSAFEESGDLFDKSLAQRLYQYIYSAGGSNEPEVLYQKFRGKAPNSEALIKKRGL